MPTQVVFNDSRKYRAVHLNALAAEPDAEQPPVSQPAPKEASEPAETPEDTVQVQTPNGKTTDVATPDPEDQPGAETTWAIPTNYLYIGGGALGLLLLMKMLKK